jgi:hypothetical protein
MVVRRGYRCERAHGDLVAGICCETRLQPESQVVVVVVVVVALLMGEEAAERADCGFAAHH